MCRTVMAERTGESENDASDTFTIGTKWQQKSSTQYATKFGEKVSAQGGRKADTEAHSAEASSGTESSSEAGASGKSCSGSAGAGVVQVVQERVVGDCGADTERARHAVCVPVLSKIAPRSRTGAGI